MEEAPKGKVEQLDLQQTPAVEAVITTIQRAEKLASGEQLVVTLGSIPFQLYDLLQQRGCVIKYEPQSGKVRGIVQRKARGDGSV